MVSGGCVKGDNRPQSIRCIWIDQRISTPIDFAVGKDSEATIETGARLHY